MRLCELCLGNESVAVLDAVAAMAAMALNPPRDWPTLAKEFSRLQLALHNSTDEAFFIGPGLLPGFALRALGHFPDLAVEVAMLSRLQGEALSVSRIIREISTRVRELPDLAYAKLGAVDAAGGADRGTGGRGGGGGRGTGGGRGHGYGKEFPPGSCWDFMGTGKCRRGDRCKFDHPAGPGDGCYGCGSADHGIGSCPEKRTGRRAANQEKVEAKLAAQSTELKELKAQLAAAQPAAAGQTAPAASVITGSLASVDPMSVYGPDAELATVFGFAAVPVGPAAPVGSPALQES